MATTKKRTTKKKKGVPGAAIAAGVVAAGAAAAAGYYFYGSKNAKKHRAEAVRFAKSVKNEVVREAKKLKDIDEKVLHGIVDRIAGAYKGTRNVTEEELAALVGELKSNWKKIQAEARGSFGSAKHAAPRKKRPAKRAARKA